MSLYDIIGEISQKQATKTDTGDTRVLGVMVGIVAKNYDKDMPGRVCVTIPTRDDKANELQWARQAQLSSGEKWGHYFLPEVGDQVLLAFEGGHIEKPYIIGCVPKDGNKFLTSAVDADNQFKRIVTKNGSGIFFEDIKVEPAAASKTEPGEKDKIMLVTAGGAHKVSIDNENDTILITDKNKENYVEMKTAEGTMNIKIKNNITIKVGDNITVTLNASSGEVKIKADGVTIDASKNIKLATSGNLSVEGAQIKNKATSSYNVESNGMTTISGSPMKLG